MKGMAVMELLVVALLRRHGVELERDVLFVAVADEEEGGHRGIHHLRRTRPELLDAAYVFNEGAYGFSEFMGKQVTMFGVCPTEKSPCWVKLVARGKPGHGSVPHSNNAVARLVRALARVETREQRARLTPAVEAMFRTLGKHGLVPGDLDLKDQATLEAVGSIDAHLGALTHDTICLTTVHAGSKHNVIPGIAEATLDCRILPDTDPKRFLDELAAAIDDPTIEIVPVLSHDSGLSSMDTPVMSAVTAAVRAKYGDAGMVVPMLSPGFTDSHAYRASGALGVRLHAGVADSRGAGDHPRSQRARQRREPRARHRDAPRRRQTVGSGGETRVDRSQAAGGSYETENALGRA